ncbi:glyoxalase [Streptomyces viridochromogenes]|uniref:Glyoxalase n=1 Tax=Streptomyces viridochromogenes TaxID=1938 RepID=A0A0L8KSQ0_STRVR|nr:glyoxalase [Streptomyces viridochromogenes]
MNVTTSTLSLTVADVDASRDFFRTHLGYEVAMAAEGFVSLSRGDAAADIVLLRSGSEVLPPEQRDQQAAGLILALTVSGIEAEERRLAAAGAPITMPLREEPWGERLFQLTDPNGVVVQLVEWATPDPAVAEDAPDAATGAATGVSDAVDTAAVDDAEAAVDTADEVDTVAAVDTAAVVDLPGGPGVPALSVITPTDENVTASPNARMTGLAAPSRGSAELSTWTVEMAAGQTGPEHVISREQVWTVTAGALEVSCGAVTEKVEAGRTFVLAPGVVRRIHAPEAAEAHVAMRADGVASVPGTDGTRALPWAR